VSPEGSEEVIQQAKKFAAREMRHVVEDAHCGGMVHEQILCGGGVSPLLQDLRKNGTLILLW
jgi:hypothetical protein